MKAGGAVEERGKVGRWTGEPPVTRVRILVHMRQGRQRLCDDAADNLVGGERLGQ